jgi:NADP oxidoreductase coenzyme F420-dependent
MEPMKIAVIGAGNVGAALGTAWAKAGHAITFGVRDVNKPELRSLCAQIGATAAPSADAARQGDVVVLALPWNTAEGAVKSLGDLTGKIVIDTMNPLAMTDGALALDRGFTTSAGETVASWLPGAKVVKTLNFLILGRQRCLLGASPRLGRVEPDVLAADITREDELPLAFPVRIFRWVGRLRSRRGLRHRQAQKLR